MLTEEDDVEIHALARRGKGALHRVGEALLLALFLPERLDDAHRRQHLRSDLRHTGLDLILADQQFIESRAIDRLGVATHGDIALVAQRLRDRDKWGAKFSIVVVAEGAIPKGGKLALLEEAHGGYAERVVVPAGQLLPVPINLDTVNKLYGMELTSFEMQRWLESVGEVEASTPTNW